MREVSNVAHFLMRVASILMIDSIIYLIDGTSMI